MLNYMNQIKYQKKERFGVSSVSPFKPIVPAKEVESPSFITQENRGLVIL